MLWRVAAAAALIGTGAAPAAHAAPSFKPVEVLRGTLSAPAGTFTGACHRSWRQGEAGVATRTVTVSGPGHVDLRLSGSAGDWDVAAFGPDGRVVAAGASPDAQEVASGWLAKGRVLRVQACRRSGRAASARVTVEHAPMPADTTSFRADPPQLVNVLTPTRADKDRLMALGLDMTEHGGRKTLGVILHGEADRRKLLGANLRWRVTVPDLVAQDHAHRRAEQRAAARLRRSDLPSGRDIYRALADYETELKTLAEANPTLVKLITLPEKTWLGRDVLGIEIAENVTANDGRPAFVNMGVHHAREWPSGEMAMEWAYELINGYKSGDARASRIVKQSRNIVVPIVNADGFNASRAAGALAGADAGRDESVPDTAYIAAGATTGGEYRRKNCRLPGDPAAGNCLTSSGVVDPGVDPNRNYGGLWGGPGADATNPFAQTYRGPAPFSEPETRNIQRLVASNQVMTLITNHTTAGLVLRAPGLAQLGDPIDENRGYKALGDDMALENGYFSQKGFELYDTTGTTEDWSYNNTGGYGFTFEVYCGAPNYETGDCDAPAFHPRFPRVVEEWFGDSDQANHVDDPGADQAPFGRVPGYDGKGNREAYYIAAESTLNEARHSVLEGTAPAGTTLRLTKAFKTQTYPQPQPEGPPVPIEFDDRVDSVYEVAAAGPFRWHVNPSTRPIVAKGSGHAPEGPPSPPVDIEGGPGVDARPCPTYYPPDPSIPSPDKEDDTCWNDHPFEFPVGGGVDNQSATIQLDFGAGDDWDLEVYKDVDGDGVSDITVDELVDSSGNGATNQNLGIEEVTIPRPTATTKYVARMINYAAAQGYTGAVTFNPPVFQEAKIESYTLTCERGGAVLSTQQVVVERGEVKKLDLGACVPSAGGPGAGSPGSGTPGGGAGPGTTTPGGGTPGGSSACVAGGGFVSVDAAPRGGGVRLGFVRKLQRPVTVSVFQQSSGRRVTGERLIARFADRDSGLNWNGRANRARRRVTDGYYFVRYRMATPQGTDTRRVVLRRTKGRFTGVPAFYRRATCDLLPSFKLTRPVFGGSNRPAALGISFRVSEQAKVTVVVLRGSTVVQRFAERTVLPNRTTRLRVSAKALRRGDYTVRITVAGAKDRLTTALVARRL